MCFLVERGVILFSYEDVGPMTFDNGFYGSVMDRGLNGVFGARNGDLMMVEMERVLWLC